MDPWNSVVRGPASGRARRADRRRLRPGVEAVEARCLLSAGPAPAPPALVETLATGLVPLIDLGAGTYQGQDGGLYGGGSNVPPASQATAAATAVARIQPLDRAGRPSADGKVAMLAIGQSTTMFVFGAFQEIIGRVPDRSPALRLVNGAQDGMVLQNWSREPGPFRVALERVRASGVTPRQVQVLFVELALIRAGRYGGFADRVARYSDELTRVLQRASKLFPNARVAFVSSRIYGGYGPQGVDPEPFAYESAFGVRRTILRQIAGDPALNPDPSRGRVRSPVLLWGPYYWANGPFPSSTGLNYLPGDFLPDGVHPGATGSYKAAGEMTRFFLTDPFATPWFTR